MTFSFSPFGHMSEALSREKRLLGMTAEAGGEKSKETPKPETQEAKIDRLEKMIASQSEQISTLTKQLQGGGIPRAEGRGIGVPGLRSRPSFRNSAAATRYEGAMKGMESGLRAPRGYERGISVRGDGTPYQVGQQRQRFNKNEGRYWQEYVGNGWWKTIPGSRTSITELEEDWATEKTYYKEKRAAEIAERAERMKYIDRQLARNLHTEGYKRASEQDLRETSTNAEKDARVRWHKFLAKANGGQELADGSISYTNENARYQPDDFGGFNPGSTRRGNRVNGKEPYNERTIRASNDRIKERNAPAVRAELREYFHNFNEQLRKAQEARNAGQKFEHLLPPRYKEIYELYKLWYSRITSGSSDLHGDMKDIQGRLARIKEEAQYDTEWNEKNARRTEGPVRGESREAPARVLRSVRVDVRSNPTAAVPVWIIGADGTQQKIGYEPIGTRRFWSYEDGRTAMDHGIRFEREVNPRSGVTHYVNVQFTKPGTYMVQGQRMTIGDDGEMQKHTMQLTDALRRAPSFGPIQSSDGPINMLHVISRRKGKTDAVDIDVQGMKPGEVRTSADRKFTVYQNPADGALRLVAHATGSYEIVAKINNGRQVALGTFESKATNTARVPEMPEDRNRQDSDELDSILAKNTTPPPADAG